MQLRAGSAATAVVMAGLLCSCESMTLAPGAEAIAVTKQPGDVQNCKANGYVRVPESVADSGVDSEVTMMRNQALGFGADVVLLTDPQNGVAYSCKRPAAAPVSGPPSAVLPAAPPVSAGGPVKVDVAKAERGDIDLRFYELGTITPLASVTVKAPVSGVLVKLGFTEGQMVQKGDFLAQIDPRSAQAALDQAEGVLKRDQALLDGARLELQGAAPRDVARQKINVEAHIGSVAADEAAVTAAKLNLDNTRIVSPMTGVIGFRQVDQGNYVTPTDANGIVVITQLQPISAVFIIPEDNIRPVSKRLTAGATLAATIFPKDCDSVCLKSPQRQIAEGRLLSIDNQIDVTTGTVKLRALFDNKDGALFPQQFVNVALLVDTLHDQVLIPTSAVKRGAPNGKVSEYVYVVDTKQSLVSVRAVKSGVADRGTTAIVDGLTAGEVVVTDGADRLRDGAKVVLPRAPAAAATPRAAR